MDTELTSCKIEQSLFSVNRAPPPHAESASNAGPTAQDRDSTPILILLMIEYATAYSSVTGQEHVWRSHEEEYTNQFFKGDSAANDHLTGREWSELQVTDTAQHIERNKWANIGLDYTWNSTTEYRSFRLEAKVEHKTKRLISPPICTDYSERRRAWGVQFSTLQRKGREIYTCEGNWLLVHQKWGMLLTHGRQQKLYLQPNKQNKI